VNVYVLINLDYIVWPHLNYKSLGDHGDDLLMEVMPGVILLQEGVHAGKGRWHWWNSGNRRDIQCV
jgi:hypothetical protein